MFAKIRIILVIILITGPVVCAQAAKVYGTIYEFSDFERPLKNVIVEVEENSTRLQYNVSGDGTYYFDISPGSYVIKARFYNNNLLEFFGEERLKISHPDESRNLDLLLFPPTDPEYEYLGDINLTEEINPKESNYSNYILIFPAALIIISIILYFVWKKRRLPVSTKTDEPVPIPPVSALPENKIVVSEIKDVELPDDLKELYDIILKKGGRTTQKDLRKEVIYGEAKVSLMIADLEDRGLIKKIKRGRSNIIIAENKK